MALDYKIYNLSEDEYHYLFGQLDTYRKARMRKERIKEWEEHIKYKADTCVEEIGRDEARRIFRETYYKM